MVYILAFLAWLVLGTLFALFFGAVMKRGKRIDVLIRRHIRRQQHLTGRRATSGAGSFGGGDGDGRQR